jgi:hypothetical protein
MKAKVNTKSNFRNLNGQWLEVKEIVGTRVTCIVEFAEFGKQSVDFTLKEVIEIIHQLAGPECKETKRVEDENGLCRLDIETPGELADEKTEYLYLKQEIGYTMTYKAMKQNLQNGTKK